jgi:hypothetical protein
MTNANQWALVGLVLIGSSMPRSIRFVLGCCAIAYCIQIIPPGVLH